jgi:hypothetical protein
MRHVSDQRIRKTEAFTKILVFHGYLATSISDLDDTFGQWPAEARAIGDGAHLFRDADGRSGSRRPFR